MSKEYRKGFLNRAGEKTLDGSIFLAKKIFKGSKIVIKNFWNFGDNVYKNFKDSQMKSKFQNWMISNFKNENKFYEILWINVIQYIQDNKLQKKDGTFCELDKNDFNNISENISKDFLENISYYIENNIKHFYHVYCERWAIEKGIQKYKFKKINESEDN